MVSQGWRCDRGPEGDLDGFHGRTHPGPGVILVGSRIEPGVKVVAHPDGFEPCLLGHPTKVQEPPWRQDVGAGVVSDGAFPQNPLSNHDRSCHPTLTLARTLSLISIPRPGSLGTRIFPSLISKLFFARSWTRGLGSCLCSRRKPSGEETTR